MGRQLVTLALGLTILGLGKFNDQKIIIRTNVRFECKDPRNAACRTNNAVSRIKILLSTLSLKRQF